MPGNFYTGMPGPEAVAKLDTLWDSAAGLSITASTNITAGTNAQGQSPLTATLNIITTAASNPSGVTLPTAVVGSRVIVINKGANAVNIYPATGAYIDTLAINTSIQVPVNGTLEFNATSSTNWYSSSFVKNGLSLNNVTNESKATMFTSPTFTGSVKVSVSAAVTAGTNTQGQGALTSDINIVTTTAANPSGVTLPTAVAGLRVTVINKGTNPISIYPASADAINMLAVNLPITLPINSLLVFESVDATTWYTHSLLSLYGTQAGATVLAGPTANSAAPAAAVPTFRSLEMTDIPDAAFKKSVVAATTADIAASTWATNVLTGYSTTQTLALTTTAASTTITTTSTAGLKVGAVTSAATVQVAAGTTVATIASATSFTVTNRANITTTAITGTGTTATATFTAQTYAPYAVGASIVITGATPATYNGTFTVTACTATSVSWASAETLAASVQGTIAFTIAAGTSISTNFAQTIAALAVDGITLALNDRVLIKNQSTLGGIADASGSAKNGIYYLSTLGTTAVPWVLTRTVDADSITKIASGLVAVDSGTTNGGLLFDNDLKTTDTLNGTAITWNRVVDSGYTIPVSQGGTGITTASGATVFAGPLANTSAPSAAAPSFRNLELTDIPGSAFKKSVRAATTAALTLNAATATLDGITLTATDRVLVKDQATSSQNGIYYNLTTTTWVRTVDADATGEIASAIVAVDEGTVNGGKKFINTFKATDTLGTTSMPWYEVLDSSKFAAANTWTNAQTVSTNLSTPAVSVAQAGTGNAISVTTPSGVGYATGAGGTVTQLTSRTTGVTLNKPTGSIVLFSSTTTAGTFSSFTVTNSLVAATDVVIVNFASATTANSYILDVTAVAAGSFRIQVYNVAAVAVAEAPVINFVVIKGVTA